MLKKTSDHCFVSCDYVGCNKRTELLEKCADPVYKQYKRAALDLGWRVVARESDAFWLCAECIKKYRAAPNEVHPFKEIARVRRFPEGAHEITRYREAREAAGLSLGHVVKLTGWYWSIVAAYDSGEFTPNTEENALLSEMYGVNPNWLSGKPVKVSEKNKDAISNSSLPDQEKDALLHFFEMSLSE